jgi:glycerol-3-phosphate acyltransferase PlsY
LNLVLIVLAYLIGAIPFAIIVTRLMGLKDPRNYGSGNPGATNVLRSGSKFAALLTLSGDIAKGWCAVWMVQSFSNTVSAPTWNIACAILATFLGHLFPVFLAFRGGKGVATALGILGALSPWLALATLLTWLLIAVLCRYSSLAALVAAVLAPLYYGFGPGFGWPLSWQVEAPIEAALALMSLLIILRHRVNIVRLIKGCESRIG